MQSREAISKAPNYFRHLRKGEAKFKQTLHNEMGISFPTLAKTLDNLLSDEALKETTDGKLLINPSYVSFAGVYISKGTIELSVIDFSGKEIHTDSKKFVDKISCTEALAEILKLEYPENIKAVSICSHHYFNHGNYADFNYFLGLSNDSIRKFVPEGIEFYLGKTCETNSWKWYDDTEDNGLNVVFSFFKNNTYYTIMKNGAVIQKRRYSDTFTSEDIFGNTVLFPVWKAINPDNMIFIESDENDIDLIKQNISAWQNKMMICHNTFNQSFEMRDETKLIVSKKFCPSVGAAFHALYSYYGWARTI